MCLFFENEKNCQRNLKQIYILISSKKVILDFVLFFSKYAPNIKDFKAHFPNHFYHSIRHLI